MKPTWLESLGSYETLPTPWVHITHNMFWEEYISKRPIQIETRKGFGDSKVLIVFYQVNQAIGILLNQDGSNKTFFRFGCLHKWIETYRPPNNQSGLHRYKCNLCGTEKTVDTSD